VNPRRAVALGRRVATIERRGRFAVAEPVFERGPQAPLARGSVDVRPGDLALVDFGPGGAKALRSLGSAERPSDVVAALLWDREGRRGFPPELEDQARESAVAARTDSPARRDLTDLATFTVDPATARDFDDAVSAAEAEDGVRLWIHIADVSAHVRPGGGLDAEAFRRGTSTYVPGTVEPMLPRVLSDEACSLAPGADRLAVTAEIALTESGAPRSASFFRSRIRSDARLNYDQLDDFFAGRSAPPAVVSAPLSHARRAAAALASRRSVGSLEIESFEPEFEFDADGAVVRAHSVHQTEAHTLIEHLMILTNERVAELLERRRVATLFRVHEQPDPERLGRLVEQLASLGVPTPPLPERVSGTEAGALAGEVSRMVAREAARRGHGRDAYTSLVLRSLKQAYYTERNLGHAGLGSPAYAHFTSPIRRYPDLIAHRALLSAIGAGEPEPQRDQVREAGWHSSERERDAMRVERDADKVCAAFLLGRELFQAGWGKSFEGEVSGLVGAGAFVRFAGELGDAYEGFLPARLLRGDRFDLNETETALVGRSSGGLLRLGDPLAVRVDAIDAPRGRVDLEPAGEPAGAAPRPRTRPKTRRPRETRRRAEHRREGRDRPER
jgi:ribonuclease R